MEHKKELEELNKKSLEKFEEYLRKKNIGKEHQEKIEEAKNKWQSSHTDFMNFLMYLETLEI